MSEVKTITLSIQSYPEVRERIRDIAKAHPGVSVHRTHQALLAYAMELASQNPSVLQTYLARY